MKTLETTNNRRPAVRCMAWVGLRLAQMALRPFLWLTATVGWNMDRIYDVLREWHLTLEKKVERNEDE